MSGQVQRRTGTRRITSAGVAAIAGVSQATVSNVLNRPDLVAAATREHVLAVMRDTGFVLNRNARSLRSGDTDAIGVLVLDIGNPFWGEVTRGVEAAAGQSDQPVVLGSSGESPEVEERLLRSFESQGLRGVLVATAQTDLTVLRDVARRGTDVVLIDRTDPDGVLPSVHLDHVEGARIAVAHLLDRGHRRIAFVNGPHDLAWCADRSRGAAAAIADVPEATLTEVTVTGMTATEGLAATDRVRNASPDGVFCVNDMVALGLMKGLSGAGVAVPADVSVIGYDDAVFSELLSPALTTVRQLPHELGFRAAELLNRGTAEPLTPPALVERESVTDRRADAPARRTVRSGAPGPADGTR